jgi:hypothetical protein
MARSMRSASRLQAASGSNVGGLPSWAVPTVDRMNASETAGYSVRLTSRRLYGEAGCAAVASVGLLVIGTVLGPGAGGGAGTLCIGFGLLAAIRARARAQSARRFKIGAIAEERVGSRLWALEDRGWLVEHDVQKAGGGDIDHLVHSPAVTFVIETKRSQCDARAISQVQRHAGWAADRYGPKREIVALVCVARSTQPPRSVDGVYEVGAPRLVDFLLDRG